MVVLVASWAEYLPIVRGIIEVVMVDMMDLENQNLLIPATALALADSKPVVSLHMPHGFALPTGLVCVNAHLATEDSVPGPPGGHVLEQLSAFLARLGLARLFGRRGWFGYTACPECPTGLRTMGDLGPLSMLAERFSALATVSPHIRTTPCVLEKALHIAVLRSFLTRFVDYLFAVEALLLHG